MTTRPKPEGCGPVIPCACGCGGTLTAFDDQTRERRYLNGHNVRAMWAVIRREVKDLKELLHQN